MLVVRGVGLPGLAAMTALTLGLGLMACAGPEGSGGGAGPAAAETAPDGSGQAGRAGPEGWPGPHAPCPVDQAGPVGAVDPTCDAQFLPPE